MSLPASRTLDSAAFGDALRAVYAELDDEIARRGPVCALSGRCCRFAEYGHTLFISAIEAAVLLSEGPTPNSPLDEGASCPWQDGSGRCTARTARPLGCRVYFCDPAYEPHAFDLSERFIARLKELTDRFSLPWDYAPMHQHLHQAVAEGRYQGPAAQGS